METIKIKGLHDQTWGKAFKDLLEKTSNIPDSIRKRLLVKTAQTYYDAGDTKIAIDILQGLINP